MPYIGKSPTGSGVRTRYYFTATGGETSLSGADDGGKTLTFSDGEYVDVYLNGVALVAGTDYGTATANTIGGLAALSGGDIVEVVVYDIYNVAKINSEAVRTRHYYTATGGETSIGTAQIPGLSFSGGTEIEVSLNGISLVQGTDYNTTAANTVGGLSALSAGNVVAIVLYEKFQLADTVSKAQGGTFSGGVTMGGTLSVTGAATATGGLNVGTIKEATGTTTAITIDSSGRVFKPATPAFHAYADDGAYITTSPIPFDNTTINIGNAFDTTNYKYVVPVSGNYFISVHFGIARDIASGGSFNAQLLKGSSVIQRAYFEESASQGYSNISFSAIHPLTAGDELTVVGSGGIDYFASAGDVIFSGYLIG